MNKDLRHLRCRTCGANRDYIEGTGDDIKCTLCGSKWKRYEHRVRLKKVLKDSE